MLKKLLITGASGFLGRNLTSLARFHWQVYGVAGCRPVDVPGVVGFQADLRRYSEIQQLLNAIRPDAVIHTAAVADINFCQREPALSLAINVQAAILLAGLCADRSIPCVFTSTDLVFDGHRPPYREEDPVCPVNIYGEHKVLAETGMRNLNPQVSICRLPLLFGWPGPGADNFFAAMVAAMQSGREINLFTDEIRTPVSARVAAQGLLLALAKRVGILHLGGKERLSRYDLGRMLQELLDLPEVGLIRRRQRDILLPAPRPPDVSLESGKAFALGFDPPPVRQQMEEALKMRQPQRLEAS
jgi:dTDP-4-dehydrorhamnose reductase